MERTKHGLIAGTLLGPLAVIPGVAIAWPLIAKATDVPGTYFSLVAQSLLGSLRGLIVAYPVALLICTPIATGLLRIGQFKLSVVVCLSLLSSFALHFLMHQYTTRVSSLALYAVLGLSLGLGYWYAFKRWAQ